MSGVKVVDRGDLRKYRTEIPNMVLGLGLTPYALALYVHLKRTAGDEGKCWKSTRTLAKETGISAGKVSSARGELEDVELIHVERPSNPSQSVTVYILDVWEANFKQFSSKYTEELNCESSKKPARRVERNSTARQSGDERNGAKNAVLSEEDISKLLTKLDGELQNDKSLWEPLVQHAAAPERFTTTLFHLLKAADLGFITLTSSAMTAIEQHTCRVRRVHETNATCSPHERKKKPLEEGKKDLPNGKSKEEESSLPSPKKLKANRQDNERRWEALLESDPDAQVLEDFAHFLAEKNKSGEKTLSALWTQLGKPFVECIEAHGRQATVVGMKTAMESGKRSFPYAKGVARDWKPDNVRPFARPKPSENRDTTDEDYRAEAY